MLSLNDYFEHLLDFIEVKIFSPVTDAGLSRVTGTSLKLLSCVLHIYSFILKLIYINNIYSNSFSVN